LLNKNKRVITHSTKLRIPHDNPNTQKYQLLAVLTGYENVD